MPNWHIFPVMTGRPKLLALKKRIADEGLEDDIFEAVAEGLSITKVCEQFGITSRKMFYDWKGKDGERHDKYRAAKLISAEAHAEQAGVELDDLKNKVLLTGPEVTAAVARSKYRQWLAAMNDRDQFGVQQGPAVVLAFGDLHFDALRKASAKAIAAPTPIITAKDIEVTDLGAGPDEDGEPYYEQIDIEDEINGAGKDGEAEAQSGHTEGPITPPAPSLAPELSDLL